MNAELRNKKDYFVKETEVQFLACYDAHSDAIFRQCFFKTSDREVAKDLMQDAFTKVWDYLAQGNEVENLKAFLYTVANNCIKDWYKKHRAVPASALEYDPFAGFEDETENTVVIAEVSLVLRSLKRLDDRDREVLMMRFVEGLPPKEIAVILGERENTISVRITRALKKLRMILDPANPIEV